MSLLTKGGFGLRTLTLSLTALLLPVPAAAQAYFGRQKVHYEDFDWRVMQTSKFKIHFYPDEEEPTRDAGRMAERWYVRLSQAFQHEFKEKPLILYADHPDFQQTNVIGGLISQGTGGVTESLRNRVIMPYTGVYAENDHVLGHELVHVFQYDLAASPAGGGFAGLSRLPLWLIEGMAEYLSLGREDPHTAMWLRDAALRGELPTIDQLGRDPRFFPYRYGQALWAYIGGKYGDRTVTEIYRFATRQGFEAALLRVIGQTPEQLSQDWITAIRATYLPVIEGRQRSRDAGDPILYDDEIGAMNLSPAVSPDGQFVAFFGRREIFTVELLLADSRTGEVVEKLTSPNRSAHFDAISFINSAGTWSPDGRKFAFIVFADGDNEISILDVASKNVERSISVENVGAINHVAWSPDGQRIAFSGMAGGISDLYVVDLPSGSVQQLTDDRYADLMPAWAPDGNTLAFVTDRQGTDLDKLVYGEMGIGLLDVNSRQVRTLELFDDAKHINPQFSPDGADLYFISNRHGFSDIYRYVLKQRTAGGQEDTGDRVGQIYQVTRLATGVSGITELSPALSVAAQSGRLMFSAFENSGNNIYGLDAGRARGQLVTDRTGGISVAGILPPVTAAGGDMIAGYLEDPNTGLPPDGNFPIEEYDTSIRLEYLGPPSFGVTTSSYGTGPTGGVSAFFGDMLGDHLIGAAIQANGTLKDIGGQAIYMNSSRRLNWGGGIGHIPYLTGYTAIGPPTAGGAREVQQILERIFIDQAALNTMYPLSTTRRFELSGGVTRYSFDREILSALFDFRGRQVTPVEQFEGESPDPITFVEATGAFVGDNSFFGFTSPVVGQRYRFQVSPTFGTLQFQSLLADYRRYFLAQPFTFAFRAMHYGRYGRNSDGIRDDAACAGNSAQVECNVLSPIFLGWENFVRGYARESIDISECVPTATSGPCPVFDRLRGSRIAVASLEVRIPLIGTEELGLINFPFLPTEISPFIDAGAAWSGGDGLANDGLHDDLVFKFATNTADRVPVFSAGVSARFNVLGYMVLEAYYAYPFQRPDRGWHLGFQLMPGW
jgi:hypothetical protein